MQRGVGGGGLAVARASRRAHDRGERPGQRRALGPLLQVQLADLLLLAVERRQLVLECRHVLLLVLQGLQRCELLLVVLLLVEGSLDELGALVLLALDALEEEELLLLVGVLELLGRKQLLGVALLPQLLLRRRLLLVRGLLLLLQPLLEPLLLVLQQLLPDCLQLHLLLPTPLGEGRRGRLRRLGERPESLAAAGAAAASSHGPCARRTRTAERTDGAQRLHAAQNLTLQAWAGEGTSKTLGELWCICQERTVMAKKQSRQVNRTSSHRFFYMRLRDSAAGRA